MPGKHHFIVASTACVAGNVGGRSDGDKKAITTTHLNPKMWLPKHYKAATAAKFFLGGDEAAQSRGLPRDRRTIASE